MSRYERPIIGITKGVIILRASPDSPVKADLNFLNKNKPAWQKNTFEQFKKEVEDLLMERHGIDKPPFV